MTAGAAKKGMQKGGERPQPSPNLVQLIAYGALAFPLAGLLVPLYIYLPSFYADLPGLSLSLVGIILFAARLWDMVTDPLAGYFSDYIRTPIGRRKPLIIAGLPLLLVSVWMLFGPPPDAGPLYLLLTSMGAYLGLTLILMPYSAWGAELASGYNERTRITGTREGFTLIGTLTGIALPVALGLVGGAALLFNRSFLMIVLPLAVLAILLLVPDRRVAKQSDIDFKTGLRALRENKPFLRLLGAYLVNGTANGFPATLFLYYAAHVLGAEDWAGVLLVAFFLSGALAIPGWLLIARRLGKKETWLLSMGWAASVFLFVPLLGAGDEWIFLGISILTGASLGADIALPASMQADVIDLDRLETGQHRAGLYFGLWGMATKLALALAVAIAFPILDLVGFSGDGNNTPNALLTLALLYSLAPALLKFVAMAVVWPYPIDAAHQVETRKALQGI